MTITHLLKRSGRSCVLKSVSYGSTLRIFPRSKMGKDPEEYLESCLILRSWATNDTIVPHLRESAHDTHPGIRISPASNYSCNETKGSSQNNYYARKIDHFIIARQMAVTPTTSQYTLDKVGLFTCMKTMSCSPTIVKLTDLVPWRKKCF